MHKPPSNWIKPVAFTLIILFCKSTFMNRCGFVLVLFLMSLHELRYNSTAVYCTEPLGKDWKVNKNQLMKTLFNVETYYFSVEDIRTNTSMRTFKSGHKITISWSDENLQKHYTDDLLLRKATVEEWKQYLYLQSLEMRYFLTVWFMLLELLRKE